MATVRELKDEIEKLVNSCESLHTEAEEAGRTFTKKEQTLWNSQMKEIEENRSALEVAQQIDADKVSLALTMSEIRGNGPPSPFNDPIIEGNGNTAFAPSRESTPAFRDTATGETIRALTSSESFSPSGRRREVPAIGDVFHSLLTGRPQGMSDTVFAEQIGGSDTAGGYVLNPTLSGSLIDLARSASVAMRAGAVTLPMNAREVHIARITQDPTAQWRAEGTPVLASEVGFDRVILRVKTLAAIVPITIELMEDSANIGTIITGAIQSALGAALDRVILLGTGAEEEPRGVRNASGVNSVSGVGTPSDYTHITSAIGKIRQANYQGDTSGLSWITHPRDGETYDGLVDSTGQPLNPSPWARDLQRYSTTALPIDEGSGSESVSVLGDFSQVLVGMRTSGVTIRIKEAGEVSDGTQNHNAISELKTFIIAHLRADVAMLRPSWMTVLDGITAA